MIDPYTDGYLAALQAVEPVIRELERRATAAESALADKQRALDSMAWAYLEATREEQTWSTSTTTAA